MDNSFIVQDLGFKYLRTRMMIAVDVDGLTPEAIGKMMQGSRQGFYRGDIRNAMMKRIAATLKEDPDLLRLEEEAEEAGVRAQGRRREGKADAGPADRFPSRHGHGTSLRALARPAITRGDELGFKTVVKGGVVSLLPPDKGHGRRVSGAALPAGLVDHPPAAEPAARNQHQVDPLEPLGGGRAVQRRKRSTVMELNVKKEKLADHGKLTLSFTEPEGFDTDQYPVHAKVRLRRRFNGIKEPRQLELAVLIKPDQPPPDPVLLDEPFKLKVTSREPIKLRRGEDDTHVRLRWDGKDRLLTGKHPKWKFRARLVDEGKAQPDMNFSEPTAGRFSLLISPRPEWRVGERLTFEVTAEGPRGRVLVASFEADVVEPPPPPEPKPEKGPRLIDSELRPARSAGRPTI